MKLYTIIVCLILGTSLQTYAMQKVMKNQGTQTEAATSQMDILDRIAARKDVVGDETLVVPADLREEMVRHGMPQRAIVETEQMTLKKINEHSLSIIPAIIPNKTLRETLKEAHEYCSELPASYYSNHAYAACLISQNPMQKEKAAKYEVEHITVSNIFKRDLHAKEAAIIVGGGRKNIVINNEDKRYLIQHCTPDMIDFIHNLALLDDTQVPDDYTFAPKDIQTFRSLPPHMQLNLRHYYPWLPHAVGSSHVKSTQPNSYKKWAFWAAIPVLTAASYLAYTWFFNKAPIAAK